MQSNHRLAIQINEVRRRAADVLRQMGAGGEDVPAETASAPHDQAYYARVRRLLDKKVTVTIHTSKGAIKVEMFAHDSPMTVDNFIELAKKKYFDGIIFHRVVPNFVVQGGRPARRGQRRPRLSNPLRDQHASLSAPARSAWRCRAKTRAAANFISAIRRSRIWMAATRSLGK